MRSFASGLVKYFVTGVVTLLPLVVTVFLVTWLVTTADGYIGPSSYFGLFIAKVAGPENKYLGYLAGYMVVVLLIIILGFLVNRATIMKIQAAIDSVFARIPLFGKIYMAVGQFVELFGRNENSSLDRFGGVGHIRIGNIEMLAFLTSPQPFALKNGQMYVMVFVPNSPIPATGFNMLVPEKDFSRLDMPIEDLAKLLMSLGLLGHQVLSRPAPVKEEIPNEPDHL
jgi:uncharacterized membrane protein